MRDELKHLADLYYLKILSPDTKIDIHSLSKIFSDIGIYDENIKKLANLNAPVSREVLYYIFLKAYEVNKLHTFLNTLSELVDVDLNALQKFLKPLGLAYVNGLFKKDLIKIGVLVSGRGTNLQAIIDAIENGDLRAEIAVVVSNKKNAYALQRAKNHGIKAVYLPPKKGEKREDYDKRLAEILHENGVALVVLAGFLRILSPWFVHEFEGRIINIHPSLLPSFAGLYGENVHRAVIEYGCKVTGCTVHFVDEEVDHGPIIVQKCVEVSDDDTPESLAQKVLEKEHEALVEAIKLIAEDKIKVVGRRVIRK